MPFTHDKFWITLFGVAVTLLYGRVGLKLYDLQMKPDPLDEISGIADNRALPDKMGFNQVLPARRGGIYDRGGIEHPLASSVPFWKVFIDPAEIADGEHDEVLRRLCEYGEFDEDKIYNAICSVSGSYHPIGETINRSVIDDIATNSFLRRCVGKEKVTRRNYPLGRQMCHIVGVVNSSGDALDGIELTMNHYLTGTNGYIKGIANVNRREIASKRQKEVPPVNGADVFLTLDQNIQYFVENALDEAMVETRAQSAWAIVQDPRTGEILAMASRPNFDPYEYGAVNPTNLWNCAIFKNYEPGSTMKGLTFAAGINEGLYKTNSLVNCDNVAYAGRLLQDHVSGDITLTVATQKSSNRGASRVAMALGRAKFEEYLINFGFGKKTRLPLPGESTGIVAPSRTWSEVQAIRIAIGQGIAVTGMQMTSLYSAIANKGIRMQPYVVAKVVGPDGKIIMQNKPTPIGQPISEKTSADMAFMLSKVTVRPGGTGWRARIPGYEVAGKTGTAQIPIGGRYSQTEYTASFVGFFPARHPRVTILVGLESPKPNYHGGTVAAPVFAKIGTAVAQYLEIPPAFPEEVPEPLIP